MCLNELHLIVTLAFAFTCLPLLMCTFIFIHFFEIFFGVILTDLKLVSVTLPSIALNVFYFYW